MAEEQVDQRAHVTWKIVLERDRHDRRMDWVAVAILSILVVLSLHIIYSKMSGSAGHEAGFEWAKTFLTTLGGVAVGLLGRRRQRESGDLKPAE